MIKSISVTKSAFYKITTWNILATVDNCSATQWNLVAKSFYMIVSLEQMQRKAKIQNPHLAEYFSGCTKTGYKRSALCKLFSEKNSAQPKSFTTRHRYNPHIELFLVNYKLM